MSEDKILGLLVGGRYHFATHEWNRNGDYFVRGLVDDDASTCCGVGAVVAATGTTNTVVFRQRTGISAFEIYLLLCAALTPGQKSRARDFFDFNDRVAKSKADILAVFDRAIEARRAEVAR